MPVIYSTTNFKLVPKNVLKTFSRKNVPRCKRLDMVKRKKIVVENEAIFLLCIGGSGRVVFEKLLHIEADWHTMHVS